MLRNRQLRGVQVLLFALLLGLMVSGSTFAQAELTAVGERGTLAKLGYGGFEEQGGIRLDLGLATKTNFSFGFYYDFFIGEKDNGYAFGADFEYLLYKQRTEEGIAAVGLGAKMTSVALQYSVWHSGTRSFEDIILYGIGSLNFGPPDDVTFDISLRPGLLLSSDVDGSPLWGGLDLTVCFPSVKNKVIVSGGVSGRKDLFEGHIGMGILFGTN